ncbi:hypothetical protein SAMD00019534_055550 [Acytostelium subglobosum LB1]|uniref:hypothetical protein n=1 Tax=Acytostelium subglobosum LB1 TaxID=1410327 RepID=UPI000644D234|nr:hypothetical protein SAMD00019534_055550 [Acytostelium subglobosum LB1]GAM22380.1 hypothetical protein SAMD00019534_055550 [Acytostelium subglobosum LB1]|eukprot:XP_012754500.1 hypothetical protein SAMD00019534_055550 [Acytostelium subglobosum LB1]
MPLQPKKQKLKQLSVFSKHLNRLKQSDEERQRNSFNQFWMEGSTVQNRQDKLPTDDRQRLQITSLGSYVSNLVIKGLLASATPIQPPHIENYSSCVLFADISGFTALTERLGNHGQEGVELLTKNLNLFFDMLIKIVKSYGGDIVKFAGDAVLTHWPTYGELTNRVRIACACALSLQRKLHNFPVPGGFLTLHIGVGCGKVSGLYVGGESSKVEFLIAGEALVQATLCEKEADAGEIYISQSCLDYVKQFANVTQKKSKANYRLDSLAKLEKREKRPSSTVDGEDLLTSMDRKFLFDLPLLMDMEDSLQRFVPNTVVNHIKRGAYLAELRYISVIFVNLSYGVPDPVKDLDTLQAIVSQTQTIVYKYEGTVRQFIIDDKGCVLIACWGMPGVSHEDDPSRAVEAAMEIVVNLFKLKVISTVGVTTGKCFCGDVGSDERREYAVVGDIVNLSARLMSHSQGGVLCDEETSRNARNIEFVRMTEPIKVKGKTTLIPLFKPIKKHKHLDNNSPRQLGLKSKLIGRQTQLLQMSIAVHELTQGKPTRIFLLEAEAGLGKSRFISEVKHNFCTGIKILKASGVQMSESTQYYVWRQLIQEYLNEDERTGYKTLQTLGPHINLLRQALDIRAELPEANRRYSAPQRAETQHMLMLRLVQTMVPPGTIIVIDDAHFMDKASWTLTQNLCQVLENHLIIISMRPLKDALPSGFTQLSNLETIQLEPLASKEEVAMLIEQILDRGGSGGNTAAPRSNKIHDEIIEEIFNRSQGNHFVIEEMVNSLRSSGVFDESSGLSKQELIEQVKVSMPRTVTSLITSRVDRLSNTQQLELKVASVIDMPFTADYLYSMMPSDSTSKQDLINDLAQLEKLHFIKSKTVASKTNDQTDVVYSFQHTRTQEVIYGVMLFSQRRELHFKIAKSLEKENGTPQSLVHHYHCAQDYSKTKEYAMKAGLKAMGVNDNKEAVKYFQLTLKCMEMEMNANNNPSAPGGGNSSGEGGDEEKKPRRGHHRSSSSPSTTITTAPLSSPSAGMIKKTPFEVVSMTRKLGMVLYNMGFLQSASMHFFSALKHMGIEMPGGLNGPPSQQQAPASAGPRKLVRLPKMARQDSLTKFFTSSLDPFEKREAILSLVLLSKIFLHDCAKSSATWCCFVSSQLAGENWNLQSEAFSIGIRVLGANGDHTTPLRYYAAVLASKETNTYVCGNSHQSWGILMAGLGRWSEAEAGFQTATESASASGDKKMMEESSIFLANCLYLMCQIKPSMTLAQQTLESSRAREDHQIQIMSLLSLSMCQFRLGDHEGYIANMKEIERLMSTVGNSEIPNSYQMNYNILKAHIALYNNDINTCYEHCRTVHTILNRCEPNNFTTYESYASLPLILIKILNIQSTTTTSTTTTASSPSNNNNTTPSPPTIHNRSKLMNEIIECMILLEKFADIFPIAQPRLLLLRSIVNALTNKEDANVEIEKSIQEAKEKANKLGMTFEEELCSDYQQLLLCTTEQERPGPEAPATLSPSKVTSPDKKDGFHIFGFLK